jgi:hypothetical protein
MSKEPCENCGDPKCECEKGKCECTPKHIVDGTKPVKVENIKDGEVVGYPKVNYKYDAMEAPIDEEFYAIKKQANKGEEVADFSKSAFWDKAVDRLEAFLTETEAQAKEQGKRIYRNGFSWKLTNDGYRQVAYNYSVETPHAYSTEGYNQARRDLVAYTTESKQMVVSKHLDDKSAMVASSNFNNYLGIK